MAALRTRYFFYVGCATGGEFQNIRLLGKSHCECDKRYLQKCWIIDKFDAYLQLLNMLHTQEDARRHQVKCNWENYRKRFACLWRADFDESFKRPGTGFK